MSLVAVGDMQRPHAVLTYHAEPLDGRQVPKVIVVHTAESDGDGRAYLLGLFHYVENDGNAVHACTARDGAIGYMLDAQFKGRHAPPNTGKIGIEQAGKASFTREQWLHRDHQLHATAKLIAWYSYRWNIPIKQSTTHGVCQHKDLPQGGHHDCGPGYPWDYVLDMARTYRKHLYTGTYR